MGALSLTRIKVTNLSQSSGTISCLINGVSYSVSVGTVSANSLYMIYFVPGTGLAISSNVNSVGPGSNSWFLVGAFYSAAANTFGAFVNITGIPSCGSIGYTSSTVNFNSTSIVSFYWSRYGEEMAVRGGWLNGAAGNAAGASISLPTGFLVNASAIPTRAGNNQLAVVGSGAASATGVLEVTFDTSGGNSASLTLGKTSSVPTGVENASTLVTGASQNLAVTFRVPIVGWTNTQLADL